MLAPPTLAPPKPLRNKPGSALTLVVVIGVAILAVAALVTIDRVVRSNSDGLVWSDDFNGTKGSAANTAIWQPAIGGKGWGNGEYECYTDSRDNSALDGDGHLVITARFDPHHACQGGTFNDYTSARLRTENLKHMHYGKLRVRAKMPTGTGVWPAIWALGDDHSVVNWPRSGEIDVAEVVGSQPTSVHTSIHGPDPNNNPFTLTNVTTIPTLPNYAWHVFGIDWTPDHITFVIDGRDTYTVTKAEVQAKGQWVFDQSFYLLLNVAVGGQFPGPPTTSSVYPQRMIVDYVRVYS